MMDKIHVKFPFYQQTELMKKYRLGTTGPNYRTGKHNLLIGLSMSNPGIRDTVRVLKLDISINAAFRTLKTLV